MFETEKIKTKCEYMRYAYKIFENVSEIEGND